MKKQCLYVAVVLLVAGVLALAAGGDEQKPQKPQKLPTLRIAKPIKQPAPTGFPPMRKSAYF